MLTRALQTLVSRTHQSITIYSLGSDKDILSYGNISEHLGCYDTEETAVNGVDPSERRVGIDSN